MGMTQAAFELGFKELFFGGPVGKGNYHGFSGVIYKGQLRPDE